MEDFGNYVYNMSVCLLLYVIGSLGPLHELLKESLYQLSKT